MLNYGNVSESAEASREWAVRLVYQEGPVDINVDILEPYDVQCGIDIVCGVLKNNLAAVTAFFKGLTDSRSIVRVIRSAPFDDAFFSVAGSGNSRAKTQPYNGCDAHLVENICKI